MHHQSHREQSMALEELLAGPRVGTKEGDTTDGDRERDGLRARGSSEDMEGRVLDSGDDSRAGKEREREKEVEESGMGQGTAQVAVLSFARITQVSCQSLSLSLILCLTLHSAIFLLPFTPPCPPYLCSLLPSSPFHHSFSSSLTLHPISLPSLSPFFP